MSSSVFIIIVRGLGVGVWYVIVIPLSHFMALAELPENKVEMPIHLPQ